MRWLALCVALWPVWIWYYQRLSDRSDEPLGLVALITLLALLWINPGKISRAAPPFAATALLAVYGLSLFCAPKLVLACLGMATVGLCLSGRKFTQGLTVGDWALLLLSLPIVASLNFYLGYPLRLLVCALAVPLLNINGFDVVSQGTALVYNRQAIEIDAPCSGIRMLWASLYLAATLASLRNLSWPKGAVFMMLSAVAAIFANVLRVTSLFYLESGTISLPQRFESVVHEGVGVAVFFLLAIGLLLVAGRLSKDQKDNRDSASDPATESANNFATNSGTDSGSASYGKEGREISAAAILRRPDQMSFFIACVVCAILPFLLAGRAIDPAQASMPIPKCGWPDTFAGEALRPVALTVRQAELAAGFPGEIKVFLAGHQTVIYRCITQATRQLHPAADCYRAGGYEIKYLPAYTDHQGLRWGACEASRGAERMQIHERIFDNRDHSWTDVSTWYWAALMGRTTGPWWSIVTVDSVAVK